MTPLPGVPGPAEPLAERARGDAAARAGVPLERARVAQFQARDWNDSSLGCPEPGMVYTQVVTPGYFIVVEANGERFEYHTDRATRLVLCEGGRPVDLTPS